VTSSQRLGLLLVGPRVAELLGAEVDDEGNNRNGGAERRRDLEAGRIQNEAKGSHARQHAHT
jgi:hypothetical protein